MRRFDERDTLFARMNYKLDSAAFEDYYGRHPEKKDQDLHLQSLPQLCSEGTLTWDPLTSPIADAIFHFLGDINTLSEQPVQRETTVKTSPTALTAKIKALGYHLGAQDVGITKLNDDHLYTYRGRKELNYGTPVILDHTYAIAFTFEMNQDMIDRSPYIEEVIETSTGYLNAGIAGMIISYWLRELGFESRNHMDGNYLLVAPLVARDAGLGEIGRMGLLTTRRSGPRIRIGIVTTNAELIEDQKDDFGMTEFCELCGKCVKTCPGKAIPKSKNATFEGEHYWKIDHEACYTLWRNFGTDCGICLSTCPFSHNINFEGIDTFKGKPDLIQTILDDFENQFGIRRRLKDPIEIAK